MATYKYEDVTSDNKDDKIHIIRVPNVLILIGVLPTNVTEDDHPIKVEARISGEDHWFHLCEWEKVKIADTAEESLKSKLYPSNLTGPYYTGFSAIRLNPDEHITATYWVCEFYPSS